MDRERQVEDVGQNRRQEILRSILNSFGFGRCVETQGDEEKIEDNNGWENKMVEVMQKNGKKGESFAWKPSEPDSPDVIFTRTRANGRKIDSILVKRIMSGVQTGESGGSWDAIGVKQSAYIRCGWFRKAVEEEGNIIKVDFTRENRVNFKGKKNNPLSSTA